MLNHDHKVAMTYRLLPEDRENERANPLSLKSFVAFLPFKVNCVAREGALGHVVRIRD